MPRLGRRLVVLWLLLIAICVGLGYSSLARYNPGTAPGLSDAASYAQMVSGEVDRVPGRYKDRLLVPMMARVPYRLVEHRLGTWNPAAFSLLLVDSMFVASTALFIAIIAMRINRSPHTAILASCLYPLTFTVCNFQLAGLIDAAEAFLIVALALSLLVDQFWCLPLLSIAGALTKETTPPLMFAFSIGWWVGSAELRRMNRSLLYWAFAAGALGVATVCIVWSISSGHLIMPSTISAGAESHRGFARALIGCFDKGFWYMFAWLLPLGAIGLRRLPAPLVAASGMATALALLLSTYCDAGGGNAGRAMFNTMGFVLVVSCADTLTNWLAAPANVT